MTKEDLEKYLEDKVAKNAQDPFTERNSKLNKLVNMIIEEIGGVCTYWYEDHLVNQRPGYLIVWNGIQINPDGFSVKIVIRYRLDPEIFDQMLCPIEQISDQFKTYFNRHFGVKKETQE